MSITLKLATSLDGKIATQAGESRWITGEGAREQVHRLRAQHDAVVVGIGTALADDPDLTVRLDDFGGVQPARVVLDSRQRLPLTSRLAMTTDQARTYVISTQPPSQALEELGVSLLRVEADADGRPAVEAVVRALAEEGLERLFVEGGGQVAASFLAAGVVNHLEWFRAPTLLGALGRPCVGVLAMSTLREAPRFRRVAFEPLGSDLWERYEKA